MREEGREEPATEMSAAVRVRPSLNKKRIVGDVAMVRADFLRPFLLPCYLFYHLHLSKQNDKSDSLT